MVPNTTFDARPMTIVNELIPIVHCFSVWKIWEELDLKAKFVALLGTTFLPQTLHRGLDQKNTIPIVGSFSVCKIWAGVESSSHLRPPPHQNNCFLKPHKPISVVQSTAVFELCKALNLAVKLAHQ
ncbi:hypothetical protein TNCV_630471 [Trichonephila clavipes]|nr:hypothetical protein TNCV_630471 [Trichonephila clavipes]